MTAKVCVLHVVSVCAIYNFSLFLGIVLEAYSPLGNPSSPFRKSKDPSVLEDPVIKEVAEKHKVSIGQVCNVNRDLKTFI